MPAAPWSSSTGRRYGVGMTAQPITRPDPEDPAEILALLPERWHAQFAAEYRDALDAARDMQQWAGLRAILHRWYLRAVAYADPEFWAAAREARDAQPGDLHPVPGLADWQ
jgi:hypothetical protein